MAAHDHDSPSELVARLTRQVSAVASRRGVMDEHERLTSEALDCAQHGLIDEARHRLRLRDRPKFRDEVECYHKYVIAMMETRAARAVQ